MHAIPGTVHIWDGLTCLLVMCHCNIQSDTYVLNFFVKTRYEITKVREIKEFAFLKYHCHRIVRKSFTSERIATPINQKYCTVTTLQYNETENNQTF